jgi:hypothetical protein
LNTFTPDVPHSGSNRGTKDGLPKASAGPLVIF